MPSGGRSPGTAAMTMTEDAKTEENTAGGSCGAYIRGVWHSQAGSPESIAVKHAVCS